MIRARTWRHSGSVARRRTSSSRRSSRRSSSCRTPRWPQGHSTLPARKMECEQCEHCEMVSATNASTGGAGLPLSILSSGSWRVLYTIEPNSYIPNATCTAGLSCSLQPNTLEVRLDGVRCRPPHRNTRHTDRRTSTTSTTSIANPRRFRGDTFPTKRILHASPRRL